MYFLKINSILNVIISCAVEVVFRIVKEEKEEAQLLSKTY